MLAAAAEPGDEVLIEPTTLLSDAARWLYRRAPLPRRAEAGFHRPARRSGRSRPDPARDHACTSLSAFTPPEDLDRIGDAARSIGARVLVDEVYLEAYSVLGRPWGSAARLGSEFVITSSLTKAYGLSSLRCGWIVAEPDLARRMWRLNDLFGVVPAHPAERLSVVALDRLDRVAERARRIPDQKEGVVPSWLRGPSSPASRRRRDVAPAAAEGRRRCLSCGGLDDGRRRFFRGGRPLPAGDRGRAGVIAEGGVAWRPWMPPPDSRRPWYRLADGGYT